MARKIKGAATKKLRSAKRTKRWVEEAAEGWGIAAISSSVEAPGGWLLDLGVPGVFIKWCGRPAHTGERTMKCHRQRLQEKLRRDA